MNKTHKGSQQSRDHKVIECVVAADGKSTMKTFKGNLTRAKAEALANRLNAKQDLAQDPIINYWAE